ncbi:MAG: S8 family serine peptidase [Actinomycetes bacterium]
MTTHRRGGSQRWRVLAAAAITLSGVALAPTTGVPAEASDHPAPVSTRVIVQADDGALGSIGRAAARLGGNVVSLQLALDTAVLDVPSDMVDDLRRVDGVRAVTEDMSVKLNGLTSTTGGQGDLLNVAKDIGATTYWRNGYVGQNVDVALLDSGVLPVEGLNTPNKLVIGPDLSLESQSDTLRGLDTFGHGTHMAGIIGGLDSGVTPSNALSLSNHFVGIAPGSRIVSLKLADAHGQTDVSQVIAGIDWVVTHAHDPGINIRVLNLSFGTDSSQDYRIDPLAHAAEVAWASGIVVVVSAGNGDVPGGGLSDPAYDPAVLAVGSVDTRGTADTSDDAVSTFSKTGSSATGKRGPDLLAPGNSLVSLRAPGSYIDSLNPGAVVNDRFFKGTGTSQSAAVVSGAAALLLSQRPSLSPDQVRDLLRRSARSLGSDVTRDAQGDGVVDLNAAYSMDRRAMPAARVNAGGGSLDAARGSVRVRQNGVTLTGERNIFGRRWDANQLATSEESGTSWTGGTFNGDAWAGTDWLGNPQYGAYWNGTKWRGATWAGATWAGATWAGGEWDGATWAGATWTGATWAGATWAGATWAGATWANNVWSSASWE